MSLLSKKSWNPKSVKNRAKVQQDELEQAKSNEAREKRIHDMVCHF